MPTYVIERLSIDGDIVWIRQEIRLRSWSSVQLHSRLFALPVVQ